MDPDHDLMTDPAYPPALLGVLGVPAFAVLPVRAGPMDGRRASLRRPSRATALSLLLALVSIGCTSEPTDPPIHGDPLPGSFYLTSDPPLAPYAVTIRSAHLGGVSGRFAQFEAGKEVVVNWSDLPLPEEKWIEVNGRNCEGTFGMEERIETDLLLVLTDDTCRVEVLGSHPEGGPHRRPGE